MIRAGLFLYLIFATVFGPGMCCCVANGLGRLATKEQPTKSCCPKHDHHKKESPPNTPSGSCPCQEDRVIPNPGWAVERSDFFEATSFQVVPVLGIIPSQMMMADSSLESPRRFAFTSLSARDILRAVHVLLC